MKRIANIYNTLFALYYLQGTFFSQGSIIGRLLLLTVLILSLYYWLYAMSRMEMSTPLKVLSFLLVVWTIYGVQPMLFGVGNVAFNIDSFYVLKLQYMSLLPIFPYYVFAQKGLLTERMMQVWTFVFLLVAIVYFYFSSYRLLQEAVERGSRREEFTNNAGYVVLSVMPLIPFFVRKPTIQYAMIGLCMYHVLIGFKRGALLLGAICSLWMIYYSFKVNRSDDRRAWKKQVIRIILTVVFFVGALYAVRALMSSSDFFIERIERTMEGDSSGRDSIYNRFFYHFLNETNIFKFLFGNGAFGTLYIGTNFAHNDWLEIAIDNGLVLIIVYAIYWISLIRLFIRSKKDRATTIMLGTFIVIYFLKSFFSMSYNGLTPFADCALGYALANNELRGVTYNRDSDITND